MFLLDLLFGRGKSERDEGGGKAHAQESCAPGTSIHHDPRLIAALKEDHELLLEIFHAVDKARKAGDLLTAQTHLDRFRLVLHGHLIKENVRLYVYLEHLLAGDPARQELMHGFRRDMDAIGKVVVAFLGKYKQIGAHPELAAEFGTDLAAIGKALVGRIQREEKTLYPMYG